MLSGRGSCGAGLAMSGGGGREGIGRSRRHSCRNLFFSRPLVNPFPLLCGSGIRGVCRGLLACWLGMFTLCRPFQPPTPDGWFVRRQRFVDLVLGRFSIKFVEIDSTCWIFCSLSLPSAFRRPLGDERASIPDILGMRL